jgi:hypothetical protein
LPAPPAPLNFPSENLSTDLTGACLVKFFEEKERSVFHRGAGRFAFLPPSPQASQQNVSCLLDHSMLFVYPPPSFSPALELYLTTPAVLLNSAFAMERIKDNKNRINIKNTNKILITDQGLTPLTSCKSVFLRIDGVKWIPYKTGTSLP